MVLEVDKVDVGLGLVVLHSSENNCYLKVGRYTELIALEGDMQACYFPVNYDARRMEDEQFRGFKVRMTCCSSAAVSVLCWHAYM